MKKICFLIKTRCNARALLLSISIPTNKGSKVSPQKFRPFLNYPPFSIEFTWIATAQVKKRLTTPQSTVACRPKSIPAADRSNAGDWRHRSSDTTRSNRDGAAALLLHEV
jgi:hypothetical protein